MNRWRILIALAMWAWLPPVAHALEFHAGPGMEYFTVKTYARDHQGRYFETIIQSTLAVAQLDVIQGPLTVAAQGGWTDWNASSDWRGYNLVPFQFDMFWSAQTYWQFSADYALLPGLAVGLLWNDHQLRFYTGETQYTYMEYRERQLSAKLGYQFYRRKDLNLGVAAYYAPNAGIEIYQDTAVDAAADVLQPYATSASGRQLSVQLTMAYQHEHGWGLDFEYQLGWASFPNPRDLADLALTWGRLSGFFWMRF